MTYKKQKGSIKESINCSKDQKQILLTFMEENINFAHEKFEGDCGAQTQQRKWDQLTEMLNATGGARKSAEQWKQYWRDLKRNVKTKAAAEKRKLEASGINGFAVHPSLDELEKRVVSIMTPAVVDGNGESQERGLNIPTIAYKDIYDIPASPECETESALFHEPQITIMSATTARANRTNKRPRSSRPSFRLSESENKMETIIKIERDKLTFEKTKVRIFQTNGKGKI